MNEKRQRKEDFKRLKSLVKKHPRLFARLAALEIESGKLKAAKKRLVQGIADFPDHTSAKTLLAECLSTMGDHETSLKLWEDIVYSEPFNSRARAGYVRELAFLERTGEMAEAIADYYGLDPLDDEISDRHQEALLRQIRSQNAAIRVWNPQWHPGDFTPAGEIARNVAARLDLTPTRESLPEEFRPKADEEIIEQLVGELEAVAHATPAGGDAAAVEGDSDEQEAVDALFDEGESLETELSEDKSDEDVELEELPAEEEVALEEIEGEEPTEAETAEGEEEEELEAAGDETSAEEEPKEAVVEEEEAEAEAEAETEEEKETEEGLPEEEPEPEAPDKLVEALEHVGVDAEGMSDIEGLVDELMTDPPYLVEEPVIEMSKSAKPIPEKAEEPAEEEKPETTETPGIDVSVEADLQEAGGEESGEPVHEELEGELTQDTLDEALASAPEEEVTETADEEELPSEEELASFAEEETEPSTVEETDEPSKAKSQDDLEVLIAERQSAETEPETEETPVSEEKPEEPSGGESMSQADLDTLIESRKAAEAEGETGEEAAVEEEETPEELTEPEVAEEETLAGLDTPKDETEDTQEAEGEPESQTRSDLDALIASQSAEVAREEEAEGEAEEETAADEEEIELPADPRQSSPNSSLSQDDLDSILREDSGKAAEVSYDFSGDEDEEGPPAFVAEELEGELDQKALDSLMGTEEHGPPDFHENMPDDDLPQEILDDVFKDAEAVEEGEAGTGESSVEEIEELEAVSEEPTAAPEPPDEAPTPSLEDLQKKLDELELISEEHKTSTAEGEFDAETEDLDRLLAQMSGLEAQKEAEETVAEEESDAETAEGINLEKELPPPDLDELEILDTDTDTEEAEVPDEPVVDEVPDEAPKPPAEEPGSIPTEALADAMRTAPPIRTVPRPVVEAEEIPPEEFKGPLTKTFAQLCLAQGKLDHAEYVLGKLLASAPADAALIALQQKIDEKRAEG